MEEEPCAALDEVPWPRLYPVPYWAARAELLPGEWREPAPASSERTQQVGALRRWRPRSHEGRMRALADAAGFFLLLEVEGGGRYASAPITLEGVQWTYPGYLEY